MRYQVTLSHGPRPSRIEFLKKIETTTKHKSAEKNKTNAIACQCKDDKIDSRQLPAKHIRFTGPSP